MKIAGIIFLVSGGISFVVMLFAAAQGSNEGVVRMLQSVIFNIVIGGFLLSMSNKKKQNKKEGDDKK